ncbi:hypothetical protein F2Q70_00029376 [Brassica cretica]|uniref:Uncharacterized protein n=1 Tax=Brassica cretica TaxID=69181 RepID=A0A8S9FPW1_BRACR|nr:hypothetical protein F2Q70_00029376 [Brassica cretica]
MTHEEFAAKHPHPLSHVYVKIDRYSDPVIDRNQETAIDRQQPAPIDQRAPITYRVQMLKIDVARLNALKPKPKPSENPPEAVKTPSYDGVDSMESRSHRRPPEESVIQESLQHATVELNTRQNTRHRSKLTLQHRPTVPSKNRPTDQQKNRSTVVQKIGKTITTIPLW